MLRFAGLVVLTFIITASYLQGMSDGKPDKAPPPPPNYSKLLDERYSQGYSAGLEDGQEFHEWSWNE